MQPFSRCLCLCLASIAFNAFPLILVAAVEDDKIVIKAVSDKIHIDGILNDPPWKSNPHIVNLTQVEPRPGEPPTEATKVWIAHTKDSLYIAVRCEDRLVATFDLFRSER